MSESSSARRPDDPLTDYRDPLTATTDEYASGDDYASTGATSGAYAGATATTAVPPVPAASGQPSTKDAAKDQAGRVGGEAKASGAHVAGVAKDQAAGVADEAKTQAKGLLHQGRSEVRSQAGQQQQRAASGLKGLGDQLGGLASGSPQPGLATDLANQASEQVAKVAQWLESREPADLLQDVQRFARRRPGAFLAIAAGVGVVAGRLTRGVAAEVHDEREADARSTRASSVSDPYGSGDYTATDYTTGQNTTGQYAAGQYATGQDADDAYATPVPYAEGDPYARSAPSGALPPTTATRGDLGYGSDPARNLP